MKKPERWVSTPRTQFEQVPVEIVKKIVAQGSRPRREQPTPLVPRIIARDEV